MSETPKTPRLPLWATDRGTRGQISVDLMMTTSDEVTSRTNQISKSHTVTGTVHVAGLNLYVPDALTARRLADAFRALEVELTFANATDTEGGN
jgi:hypothetical protein